jgi:TPR repeat protein
LSLGYLFININLIHRLDMYGLSFLFILSTCVLSQTLHAEPLVESPESIQQFISKPATPLSAAEIFKRGRNYDRGIGVDKDPAKALELYRKAADLNYAEAQLLLGIMFDQGIGLTQDYAQALDWYRKAAEQGYAKAQYNLAALYDEGLGVEQDYSVAGLWYRKAAEQGYANAQFNLGAMYLNAEGMPPDNVEGYMWLKLAADQGLADKVKELSAMVKSLTPAQIKQGQKRAIEWQKKHTVAKQHP